MTKKPPILMSTDRPLDALLPDLREAREPLPKTPVHQRVLEVDMGDEGFEWVFACWQDPGGARALHPLLRDIVEATLLAQLSQPASAPTQVERAFRRLRLYCFSPIEGALADAVKPFGFKPAPYSPDQHIGRMAALSEEAIAMGWRLPKAPHSVWCADVQPPTAQAQTLQKVLLEKLGAEVWGQTPGFFSKALAEALEGLTGEKVLPNIQSIRAVERAVGSNTAGVVRWIPPLVFQALCDLIGVVMVAEWGHALQWAVCDQDPIGLYPPPHFRLHRPGSEDGAEHFLVGQQVLQWCVMPLQPGEQIPPLWQWVLGTFEQVRPY